MANSTITKGIHSSCPPTYHGRSSIGHERGRGGKVRWWLVVVVLVVEIVGEWGLGAPRGAETAFWCDGIHHLPRQYNKNCQ